mmetsp:Transcript_34572/g.83630  ORF Transcript_34572/g.83630 Transcript_34572/m.83630 type:complete len:550 (-) Transcript_34572:90-1739(-)
MPKRSRPNTSESKNPLSSARKDAGSRSNNGAENKADRNARSLWHRKSGAGYHLFLSYYGSQPTGVVVAADEGGGVDYTVTEGKGAVRSNNSVGGARGMSRAAKRRRQKKGSIPILNPRQSSTNGDGVAEFTRARNDAMPLRRIDTSHPLVQAFAAASASKNHPRLARFVHALSRPLPLTLRFRGHERSTPTSEELKRLLSANHSELIAPVSFDPTHDAIYQSAPNSSLCRSNLGKLSPELKELIVDGSTNGTLARQEMGSMLPVLCLRSAGALEAGSRVLDLCASPGSKTLQALEIVGGESGVGGKKRGRVIANDVHPKRLDALREAVIRSGVPDALTSRVTYTNHDASVFPPPKSGRLFGAIVCDVPCGGDGTIRKDRHILPMWSPNISNAIHGLQLKILKRALKLVKVGGVVCYSTCSLNPIEDEAVVAAALSEGDNDGGASAAFELLDWPRDALPGFVRHPGVNDWRVAFYDQDNAGEDEGDFGSLSFFDSYNSALAAGVEGAERTFWPIEDSTKGWNLRLDRCTRLLPQDQDTGGFFLALIKRTS